MRSSNFQAITDFDFSAEFNRAIEEKVRAEQEALKAKNEKLRRVTQAEAAAAERTLAADAAAYEIEVESKARAAAIERPQPACRLGQPPTDDAEGDGGYSLGSVEAVAQGGKIPSPPCPTNTGQHAGTAANRRNISAENA